MIDKKKIDFKRRKVTLDIGSLSNCLKHELIPKFVQFKVANRGLRCSRVYKDCQFRLLNQEIKEKKKCLHLLDKKFDHLKDRIRLNVNSFDFAHISNRFLGKNDRVLNKVRLIHEKKLFNLGFRTASETNDPQKVIFNFSSYNLTPSEKTLLVKGMNLSIPPKKLNYGDYFLPFESLYKQMLTTLQSEHNCEGLDPVGASIKDAAYDCLYSYDPKVDQNLSEKEYNALKSLLRNDAIIIQKSDKGNSVVILNKSDYQERMNELLNDESKFKKLKVKEGHDYNYIINQELRISKILRELVEKGSLSKDLYEKLNPTGSQPSIMYGLSKVHKPTVNNVPKLRPIMSAIKTPTYKLAQYIVELLKPFTSNEYTAKDSFTFAADIHTQQSKLFMASLDVDSLFTNIPLLETIELCTDLLFHDKDSVDGLKKDEFRQLLTLATKDSFILFDGTYYQQVDGVAMGSPLGPTLANIFLGFHEKIWLADCPVQFKPKYYKRYVDDIFVLFDKLEFLDKFQEYMNRMHPNMHFTSEVERNDSLPFLDVNVIRDVNMFMTSIYRKPTFSGVYTNYDSYLPTIYKQSLVSTLLFRAYTICSNWNLVSCEMNNIKSIMLKNGYPESFIDRLISSFISKLYSKKQQPPDDNPKKSFQIFLPYLGTFSKRIEKKIKASLRTNLPKVDVKFVYRAATRLNNLFAFKDKIPSYLRSGIVYKFKCGGCNSTYIGESIRHSKRRFCEHMGISALTGKVLKGQNITSVRDHIKKCKCNVSLTDFTVLCRDNISEHNLRIKESLFVQREKPNLNIQGTSIPLVLFKN